MIEERRRKEEEEMLAHEQEIEAQMMNDNYWEVEGGHEPIRD